MTLLFRDNNKFDIVKKKHSTRFLMMSVLFPTTTFKLVEHVHNHDGTSNCRRELMYFVHPKRILFPTNMVRTSVIQQLRMRKQNTNKAVPLDAVPERRTKRCSPRFRPGGRFCELRFRYQSSPTGSEGEMSRPLDHM